MKTEEYLLGFIFFKAVCKGIHGTTFHIFFFHPTTVLLYSRATVSTTSFLFFFRQKNDRKQLTPKHRTHLGCKNLQGYWQLWTDFYQEIFKGIRHSQCHCILFSRYCFSRCPFSYFAKWMTSVSNNTLPLLSLRNFQTIEQTVTDFWLPVMLPFLDIRVTSKLFYLRQKMKQGNITV